MELPSGGPPVFRAAWRRVLCLISVYLVEKQPSPKSDPLVQERFAQLRARPIYALTFHLSPQPRIYLYYKVLSIVACIRWITHHINMDIRKTSRS